MIRTGDSVHSRNVRDWLQQTSPGGQIGFCSFSCLLARGAPDSARRGIDHLPWRCGLLDWNQRAVPGPASAGARLRCSDHRRRQPQQRHRSRRPLAVLRTLVGPRRLELQTSCVSSRRSNQLSYGPLPTGASFPTQTNRPQNSHRARHQKPLGCQSTSNL